MKRLGMRKHKYSTPTYHPDEPKSGRAYEKRLVRAQIDAQIVSATEEKPIVSDT